MTAAASYFKPSLETIVLCKRNLEFLDHAEPHSQHESNQAWQICQPHLQPRAVGLANNSLDDTLPAKSKPEHDRLAGMMVGTGPVTAQEGPARRSSCTAPMKPRIIRDTVTTEHAVKPLASAQAHWQPEALRLRASCQ